MIIVEHYRQSERPHSVHDGLLQRGDGRPGAGHRLGRVVSGRGPGEHGEAGHQGGGGVHADMVSLVTVTSVNITSTEAQPFMVPPTWLGGGGEMLCRDARCGWARVPSSTGVSLCVRVCGIVDRLPV